MTRRSELSKFECVYQLPFSVLGEHSSHLVFSSKKKKKAHQPVAMSVTGPILLAPSLRDSFSGQVMQSVANAAVTAVVRRAKLKPIKSASECTSPHEQRSQLKAFRKVPEVGMLKRAFD